MTILGPPPEFGPCKEPPPLITEPVIIFTGYFEAEAAGSQITGTVLRRLDDVVTGKEPHWKEFREVWRWLDSSDNTKKLQLELRREIYLANLGTATAMDPTARLMVMGINSIFRRRKANHVEVRRLIYTQRWLRDGEIIQVPPGVTKEHASGRTLGISTTETKEFSAALGLSSANPAKISTELTRRIGVSVSVTEQRSISDTVRLANDTSDRYRRYALWNVQHHFVIDALTLDQQDGEGDESMLRWEPRTSPCFVMSSIAESMTYCEVAI
jgi:hypothetical protein